VQRMHRLASTSIFMALAACATVPVQELAVADMLPVNEAAGPSAPAYTLFFDLDSAAITADAAAILDQLVKDPERPHWRRILVAGHTDRSGPEHRNRALSADRAAAVRRYLLEAGVPPATIASLALGEREGLVGTPDGIVEAQNRRVEIHPRDN
jgi:outer membrane protein OmpA-like peptidoglycan-associated protein